MMLRYIISLRCSNISCDRIGGDEILFSLIANIYVNDCPWEMIVNVLAAFAPLCTRDLLQVGSDECRYVGRYTSSVILTATTLQDH